MCLQHQSAQLKMFNRRLSFIYLFNFFFNLKSHHSMVVYTEPDIKQSGQLCETPWGPRSSGFTACQLVLVI